LKKSFDLSVLKQKIELYCTQNNIITPNKDDDKQKLNYIKTTLKKRINSLQKEEKIEKFTHN